MKAVVLDKITEAKDIILSECPIPDVRPGWILVKVKAFGLNHSEQILRLNFEQDVFICDIQSPVFLIEADDFASEPYLDDFIQSGKSSSADEKDVSGVKVYKFLVRMLSSTLRRYIRDSAFYDLEESLLYAFTADIPCYGCVF